MIILPAIDIKAGKVVRLLQGHFDKVTEYSQDPVAVARHWVEFGAQWIHVVDLDGAQLGEIKNFDAVSKIAQAVDIPIQMGGGISEKADIEKLLQAGVERVVLGTRVIQDREFFKDILRQWPDKIAVSVDCQNGMVAQRGWTQVTSIQAIDFAKELEQLGLQCLIYTDISRDGMLTGPNIAALEELLDQVQIGVISSGGVSGLEDIEKLLALTPKGLIGAITGKAIYEGNLDLKEAIQLCSQKG